MATEGEVRSALDQAMTLNDQVVSHGKSVVLDGPGGPGGGGVVALPGVVPENPPDARNDPGLEDAANTLDTTE